VSTAAKTLLDRQVYAFRQDGHLHVKRMRMRMQGSTVVAESDNPDRETYPDMVITAKDDDFEVISRVLWMGARL
jgi:phage repressor protein C with HTH and peptisase S24 domain